MMTRAMMTLLMKIATQSKEKPRVSLAAMKTLTQNQDRRQAKKEITSTKDTKYKDFVCD